MFGLGKYWCWVSDGLKLISLYWGSRRFIKIFCSFYSYEENWANLFRVLMFLHRNLIKFVFQNISCNRSFSVWTLDFKQHNTDCSEHSIYEEFFCWTLNIITFSCFFLMLITKTCLFFLASEFTFTVSLSIWLFWK